MIVLTKSLAFFASSWWAIAHMLCGKRALFVEEAFDFPFITVLGAFCWQLSETEARDCGNRGLTSATPGATLPEKTIGFGTRERFHP